VVLESRGQVANAAENVIVLPWNDPELLERTLSERGAEVAAVIMEPVLSNSGGILPLPGYLEVTVIDETGPGPAKLQLVGFDPSPPLVNNVSISQAGVYGNVAADPLAYGISLVEFIGVEGDSGRLTVEPGEYQLVLSRGPRYSAYKKLITIESGKVTTVQGEIAQVMETEGFVHGDFHVHGIDSHDAQVTREERVTVYLAEGMDFFTPSDHDNAVDFSGTLKDMGVEHLLGTAPGAEVTTYDYGHFNTWPVTVDETQLNGGSIDWGRAAQPGMDFPEYGSYQLLPEELFEGMHDDPLENVVQISHISSHFGAPLRPFHGHHLRSTQTFCHLRLALC